MTTTTNLGITHIDSSQAQKEVTANAAFANLDKAITDTYNYQMPSNANQTLDAATCLKCMTIVVTSAVSLTAQRDLILPLNIKLYLVRNSTTGTQNVRVKGATGSGVVIPKNAEVWVRCDGTNFGLAGANTAGVNDVSPYVLFGAPAPTGSLPGAMNVQAITSTLQMIASGDVPLLSIEAKSGHTTNIQEWRATGGSVMSAMNATGNLDLQSAKRVINALDPSSAQHVATKNYVDVNKAPIGSEFLVKSADATLTNEIDISAIATTLVFASSNGANTAFAVKAGSAPSVNVFEVRDNGGATQFAIDSSFQIDAKTHKIVNVVDPTTAQQAATKNYVDVNASPACLSFSFDSLTVSVGTTYFAWVGSVAAAAQTTERWFPLPRAGKIAKLRVICAVAPAGGSVTFTIRKKAAAGGTGAGTDTALLCTMALGATLATDLSNTVTVAAGDEISCKIIENAGYSGSMARAVIMYEYTLA